jgi:tetratricopeptide (TPR) repeat protein
MIMRCRKARKIINSAIDGPLGTRTAAALEKHLETCPGCREFEAELRSVVRAASRLERPEPSEAAWAKIRSGIKRSAGISPVPAGSRFRPWRFGWGPLSLRHAGAAFLGLVLIVAGLFFGIRLKEGRTGLSFNEQAEYTLAKLDEAEEYYLKAIGALGEAFATQQGTLIPEVAEMFARNLEVIDASIQACRQAVLAEPEDLQARNFLLAAYMEKVSFLNTALEYPRRTPAILDPGRGF